MESRAKYLGPRWGAEEGKGMSRGPNPERPALEADVAAFLAAGGEITQAGPPRRLECGRMADKRDAGRRWIIWPVEAKAKMQAPMRSAKLRSLE